MSENYIDNDPTTSKVILEMLTVAHEYCLFFERAGDYSRDDITGYFIRIAPLLYLKASMLPVLDVTDESFNERFVTEEQWETVYKALRDKLAEHETYYVLDHRHDTRQAGLADNMADIYQDMKDFVMLYQKGPTYARENAVYQIRELMGNHWGIILLDALKECHIRYFGNPDDDDIFEGENNGLL